MRNWTYVLPSTYGILFFLNCTSRQLKYVILEPGFLWTTISFYYPNFGFQTFKLFSIACNVGFQIYTILPTHLIHFNIYKELIENINLSKLLVIVRISLSGSHRVKCKLGINKSGAALGSDYRIIVGGESVIKSSQFFFYFYFPFTHG